MSLSKNVHADMDAKYNAATSVPRVELPSIHKMLAELASSSMHNKSAILEINGTFFGDGEQAEDVLSHPVHSTAYGLRPLLINTIRTLIDEQATIYKELNRLREGLQ